MSFSACFLTDLHCRKSFLVLGTMLVNVTVEINRHEQCDSHDPASIPNTFLIWCSPWYEMMMDWFLRADESAGLYLCLRSSWAPLCRNPQFVSQLMNRFSQIIKRDERTEEIIIYVCRFRRCWERLETLQKTEIKLISSTLHPITCSNIRFDWSLVTQSSTFTASASFFSDSLYHIRATDSSICCLHYMWTFWKMVWMIKHLLRTQMSI